MLTDTFIKSLRPAPMPKKHFDGNGTGLHLISHPGGKRTFAIKYLHPVTRKEQTLNVGEYPTTTLKDARDQAINTRVVLAQGLDPRELRAEARMKEMATIVDTFKNLGRDWIQVRGAGWSDSYRDKTETMLDRHLFSSLGAFPITQITAPQLLAVLRPIEATGKTDLAHTLMQHAGAIFRFAMATARGNADPAYGFEARVARLGDGRQVRQKLRALERCDTEPAQLAGLYVRQSRRYGVEHGRDLAADQLCVRIGAAFERHVVQFDIGGRAEHFHCQMAGRAGA